MTTKSRKQLFERLKQGLEEGIAHSKGELTLKTIEVPDDPPEIDAATLAALRNQVAMSQRVFAKLLSVSCKTLQSWEQGVRKPSDSSLWLGRQAQLANRRGLLLLVREPSVIPVAHS